MKPMLPVTPICIEVTAPRRPAIIPSGRPKFSPQPDCIIGTIASTRMPFIPTRTSVSEMEASMRTPTKGAAMKSASRKSAIIIRGQPAFSINCFNLPCIVIHLRSLLICRGRLFFDVAEHQQSELFRFGGGRKYA